MAGVPDGPFESLKHGSAVSVSTLHQGVINPGAGPIAPSEWMIASFAFIALLVAQWVISAAIPGTIYRGGDGSMVQAVVYTAWKFGGFFDVTNINPLQGIGSQLLPKNAWANPAFWPFAIFDRELATEISNLVALGCYASACYVRARCFDIPALPSAILAQMCIVLFAPLRYVLATPANFAATPADAVTYAPYMIALGLLSRLEAGSWRRFVPVTVGLTLSLLYSVYCDPAF